MKIRVLLLMLYAAMLIAAISANGILEVAKPAEPQKPVLANTCEQCGSCGESHAVHNSCGDGTCGNVQAVNPALCQPCLTSSGVPCEAVPPTTAYVPFLVVPPVKAHAALGHYISVYEETNPVITSNLSRIRPIEEQIGLSSQVQGRGAQAGYVDLSQY